MNWRLYAAEIDETTIVVIVFRRPGDRANAAGRRAS
jgi:hypothetical protein